MFFEGIFQHITSVTLLAFAGLKQALDGRCFAIEHPCLALHLRGVFAHFQYDLFGGFFARAGHIQPARRDLLKTQLRAQHVVDDVIVRVVELHAVAAARAVVRAQRKVQHFMRQHEHQLVVFQLGNKRRIRHHAPGGKHAHRRHACIDVHARGGHQARQMRKRHGDHAQAFLHAGQRIAARQRCSHQNCATFFSKSNIALSAPNAPQRSTRSVTSVS